MKLKLYWVETDDHDEDWFVIASTNESAQEFHELNEGYADGEAVSQLVMPVPENVQVIEGWPDEDVLKKLGAEVSFANGTRIVKVAGKTYCEGHLQSQIDISLDRIQSDGSSTKINELIH